MDNEGWRARWREGRIGFHMEEVNPRLVEYWPALGLGGRGTVFVPLAGKTLDMRWLRDAGHDVLGIDVSPIAVRDFFAEADLEPSTRREVPFDVSEASGIRMLCGDFFDLSAQHLSDVQAVYDRASIVALPPDVRQRYAAALTERLPATIEILLLSFEYDQSEMEGPPWSVEEDELRASFEPAFSVKQLFRSEAKPPREALAARGMTSLRDSVYRIRR